MKTCEICGTLLFNETDTRCARCLNAGKVQTTDNMPGRSPIMAKPDSRYAIRNPRPEYDGIPDPELPSYQGHADHLGFDAIGVNSQNNPSNPAYKVWTRVAIGWAILTTVLTAVLIWKHHMLSAMIWIIVSAVILGFCTPNRYMQEEYLPDEFLTHRLSRAAILIFIGGVPAFFIGWLAGWILGKIFGA